MKRGETGKPGAVSEKVKNSPMQYTSGPNMSVTYNNPNDPATDPLTDDLISDFKRLFMLSVLYEGPIHGYGITRRYEAAYHRVIGEVMVYGFLSMLLKNGYVTLDVIYIGTKVRKVYELTESGRTLCKVLFARFREVYSVAIESI